MPQLRSKQILAVVLIATAGTLAAIQIFNVYQAVCLGIIAAIFAYGVILSLEEKHPPTHKH
jgi:predicted branched-subunit amino acid permease